MINDNKEVTLTLFYKRLKVILTNVNIVYLSKIPYLEKFWCGEDSVKSLN